MSDYGFSESYDWSFLKNATLRSIYISIAGVQLKFDQGQDISVFSDFEHFRAARGEATPFKVGTNGQCFTVYELLDHEILEVARESRDRLRLIFDNGDTLTLIRDGELVESMTLYGPKGKPHYVIE